jgi:hypothetical protein
MTRRTSMILALAASFLGLTLASRPAEGAGYMPGACCHWFGYGWGPGYHAPLLRGPVSCCDGWMGQGVRVLPYRPTPAAACYGCDGCQHVSSPLFQSSALP